MTIPNRELSQFGSFVNVDDNTKLISIGSSLYVSERVGIGTSNFKAALSVGSASTSPPDLSKFIALYTNKTQPIESLEMYLTGLKVDKDGNIYLRGYDESSGTATSPGFLTKIDNNANVVWESFFDNNYPNSGANQFETLEIDQNSSYSYVGFLTSYPTILKFNSSGTITWQKAIVDTTNRPTSISIDYPEPVGSPSKIYFSFGNLDSGTGYLIKTDESGSILWQKSFNSTPIQIVVGNDHNVNVLFTDHFVKFDSSGTFLWGKSFTNSYSQPCSLVVTSGECANILFRDGSILQFTSDGTNNYSFSVKMTDTNVSSFYNLTIDSEDSIYVWADGSDDGYLICYSATDAINLGYTEIYSKVLKTDDFYINEGNCHPLLTDIYNDKIILGGHVEALYIDGTWINIDNAFIAELPKNGIDVNGKYGKIYNPSTGNGKVIIDIEDAPVVFEYAYNITVNALSLTISTPTYTFVDSVGVSTIAVPDTYGIDVYPRDICSIDALQRVKTPSIETEDLVINSIFLTGSSGSCGNFSATKNSYTCGKFSNYIGYEAGTDSLGDYNNYIGAKTAKDCANGSYNNFIGYCVSGTSGSFNNLFGYGVGGGDYFASTSNNNFFGKYAGKYNSSGYNNNFFGQSAGHCNYGGNRNVFIGVCPGYNNSNGSCNVAIGVSAAYSNLNGSRNIVLGNRAGYASSDGSDNIFLGHESGYCNTSNCNIFIGRQTGYNNTTGNYNINIGNAAGYSNTSGAGNVFFGVAAGYKNTTGSWNHFIGQSAGQENTEGTQNNFIGLSAGKYNTTGGGNQFFGSVAGFCNRTGSNNVFIGPAAGYGNTNGCSNNFIGYYAGSGFGRTDSPYTTTGQQNNFFGWNAGRYAIGTGNNYFGTNAGFGSTTPPTQNTGIHNNFFSLESGCSNTSGSYNNFFGRSSGMGNTSGTGNNFLGPSAGRCNRSGNHNNFLGFNAGFANTTGCYNNFFGVNTGCCNSTGTHNNFIGGNAGWVNTIGCCNNFIGNAAGFANTSGSWNNFFGYQAGLTNSIGSLNNFIGYDAGNKNISGNNNNYIGRSSGFFALGSYNNFFGRYSGRGTTTGCFNVALGENSGGSVTFGSSIAAGSQNVIVGYNQQVPIGGGSNQLVIGAGNTSWIVGNNNYNVGIGTTIARAKLYVNGTVAITTAPFTQSGTGSTITASSGDYVYLSLPTTGTAHSITISSATVGQNLKLFVSNPTTSKNVTFMIGSVGAGVSIPNTSVSTGSTVQNGGVWNIGDKYMVDMIFVGAPGATVTSNNTYIALY